MPPPEAATLPRPSKSIGVLGTMERPSILDRDYTTIAVTRRRVKISSDLQQDKPFLVIERAFFGVAGRAGGPGQGPVTWAATMAFLRLRKAKVPPQVHLLGGDRLRDVAADDIHLTGRRIDRGDHIAMGAPDRTRIEADGTLLADAYAIHLIR